MDGTTAAELCASYGVTLRADEQAGAEGGGERAAKCAGEGAAEGGAHSSCPLITRLSSGEPVSVLEASLVPLLQRQLDEAASAADGPPDHIVLLCAGRFDGLRPPAGASLLKPFECAAAVAAALGVSAALLCVPTADQASHSMTRWRSRLSPAATLRTHVLGEDPSEAELEAVAVAALAVGPGCAVILDFVGHPPEVSAALRRIMHDSARGAAPTVIDVGESGLAMLRATLMAHA